MLGFTPNFSSSSTVLCLGAHCDDIEIGCGGTLIELKLRYPELNFVWIVFSADDIREPETRSAAARLLGKDTLRVEVHRFRGSYLPYAAAEVKDTFESLRGRFTPQLIFTHFLHDRHQDHRVIAELTWNTFRDHAILEYEIPKFEGDLAHPNVYMPLSRATVDHKIDTLMTCFPSQLARTWFDADLFRGHLRIRGVECNAHSRFAEAFHGRKLTL